MTQTVALLYVRYVPPSKGVFEVVAISSKGRGVSSAHSYVLRKLLKRSTQYLNVSS